MISRINRPMNWIQWLTLLLAMSTAITFIIVFHRLSANTAHRNDALTEVICTIKHAVQHNNKMMASDKKQALKFYDHLLAEIHAKSCKKLP